MAQRIAQQLRWTKAGEQIDPDVVYAAALAHDLGHPPFGHAAEAELHSVLMGRTDRDGGQPATATPILRDGFEGNAQTTRIVARLAARVPEESAGLNLTWRTYGALLKYPWLHGRPPEKLGHLSNKWGAYDSEEDILECCKERVVEAGLWGPTRSLEAEIMDWADDIAYAVHDVEDFFRAGLIPLDRMAVDDSSWEALLDYCKPRVKESLHDVRWDDKHESWFSEVVGFLRLSLPETAYDGGVEARQDLHRFASDRIANLTDQLKVTDQNTLYVNDEARIEAEVLKKATRFYVIERPGLALDQSGQCRVVRTLFFDLYEMAKDAWLRGGEQEQRRLPILLNAYCDLAIHQGEKSRLTAHALLARATTDYLCTLTDRQAILLAHRLSGEISASGFLGA